MVLNSDVSEKKTELAWRFNGDRIGKYALTKK
jgi:hypothetical protein